MPSQTGWSMQTGDATMSQTEPYAAPVLELSHPGQDKWQRERHAFHQLLPELLQNYRNRFVAVHEGRVVDSDDALLPLAGRVYAKYGYVPIYMDRVTERPGPPVHIPRYRPLAGP